VFEKLADAFGLTVPASGSAILGAPGTAIFGGYVESKESNSELVGDQRWITYSDLLTNVSIVAAGARHFLNLVAKAGWTFEAPEGSGAEGKRIAEACEMVLKRMKTPLSRVVRRTSTFRLYGFSMQEWVTNSAPGSDGIIGFYDVMARPQSTIERWYRSPMTDEIDWVVQRVPQDGGERWLPRRQPRGPRAPASGRGAVPPPAQVRAARGRGLRGRPERHADRARAVVEARRGRERAEHDARAAHRAPVAAAQLRDEAPEEPRARAPARLDHLLEPG
jgi:hypothetical protein